MKRIKGRFGANLIINPEKILAGQATLPPAQEHKVFDIFFSWVYIERLSSKKSLQSIYSINAKYADTEIHMIEVEVRGDLEFAIRQLKKKLQIDGIKRELKRREYYEKPSVKKRRKQAEARRKLRKFNRMRRTM